ncbi:MAG: exodeoxyribonuclease VII large subunit [Ignavibacteria bacterium]|nr:MAG: exodeoxyribonuclease VII large subunit [Ignavibacteria bacterium]
MTDAPDILTISQITRAIKDTLEKDFQRVTVAGEISNFHRHGSGHLYFTLKDAGAQLSSVMFRGSAMRTFFKPENGMEVVCRGRISVYEPRGNYQLIVEDMQPRGEGALQLAFEKLKRRLHAEGLFDESRKKELPAYPEHVAVITSPTGAAVRDMISVIQRRNPSVEVLMLPVQVQGAGAAEQIAEALDLANEYGEIDVIITGRGGGSIEDLWAFNEEIVARAISRSHIPVVSAVGHEVDVTIADYAADLRAATPSVAGELVVPSRDEIIGYLESVVSTAGKFVDLTLRANTQRLRLLLTDRAFTRLEGRLQSAVQLVDERFTSMERLHARGMEHRRHQVELLKQRLLAHDPERYFRKGAVLLSRGEERVHSVTQLQPGDFISLYLRDGTAQASIIQTDQHGEEKN